MDGFPEYVVNIIIINCSQQFFTNSQFDIFRYLVGHYRNHHGGLPPGMEDREQFICEQCSQVFLSENSLHNHISNKHIKGR